jgi:hypothetical protein
MKCNYFNNWIADSDGLAKVFDVLGGVSAALVYSLFYLPDASIASCIPVYIWGKKHRSFWHRHNILKLLHLETEQNNISGLDLEPYVTTDNYS